MFDVYSLAQNVSGSLIRSAANTLVYMNTSFIDDTGVNNTIEAGSSYEVVCGDNEPTRLDFESKIGAGDGVSDQIIIDIIVHRNIEKVRRGEDREHVIESLKAAIRAIDGESMF